MFREYFCQVHIVFCSSWSIDLPPCPLECYIYIFRRCFSHFSCLVIVRPFEIYFGYAFKLEFVPGQNCYSTANSQHGLDERLRPSALRDLRALQAPCKRPAWSFWTWKELMQQLRIFLDLHELWRQIDPDSPTAQRLKQDETILQSQASDLFF